MLIASFALCLAPALFTGCKGVERTTYRITGVTAASADKAMHAWGAYVSQQRRAGTPVPLIQELQVKNAFNQYQLALKAVTDAGLEYSIVSQSGNNDGLTAAQVALNNAASVLGASIGELVELISSFGVQVR